MKVKFTLKPFVRMTTGHLINAIKAYRNGVIDVSSSENLTLHALRPRLRDGLDRDEILLSLFDTATSLVLRGENVRYKIVNGRDEMTSSTSYTAASLLFDLVDAFKDEPMVAAQAMKACLPDLIDVRQREVASLTSRDGKAIPRDVLNKITRSIDHVKRMIDNDAINASNLRSVRVTHVAPGYTWNSWDDFKE